MDSTMDRLARFRQRRTASNSPSSSSRGSGSNNQTNKLATTTTRDEPSSTSADDYYYNDYNRRNQLRQQKKQDDEEINHAKNDTSYFSYDDDDEENNQSYPQEQHEGKQLSYGSPLPGDFKSKGIPGVDMIRQFNREKRQRELRAITESHNNSILSRVQQQQPQQHLTPSKLKVRSPTNSNTLMMRTVKPVKKQQQQQFLPHQHHHQNNTTKPITITPRKRVVKISSPQSEEFRRQGGQSGDEDKDRHQSCEEEVEEEFKKFIADREALLHDPEQREMLIEAMVYEKMKRELDRMESMKKEEGDRDSNDDDDEEEECSSPSLCQITELSQTRDNKNNNKVAVEQHTGTDKVEKQQQQLLRQEAEEEEEEEQADEGQLSSSDVADLIFLLETQQSDFRINIEKTFFESFSIEIALEMMKDRCRVQQFEKSCVESKNKILTEQVSNLEECIHKMDSERAWSVESSSSSLVNNKQQHQGKEEVVKENDEKDEEKAHQSVDKQASSPSPSSSVPRVSSLSWPEYREKLLHFIQLTSNKPFYGTCYTVEDLESTLDAAIVDLRAAAALSSFVEEEKEKEKVTTDDVGTNTNPEAVVIVKTQTTACSPIVLAGDQETKKSKPELEEKSTSCNFLVFEASAEDEDRLMNCCADDDDLDGQKRTEQEEVKSSLLELQSAALQEKCRRLQLQLEKSLMAIRSKNAVANQNDSNATNNVLPSTMTMMMSNSFTSWKKFTEQVSDKKRMGSLSPSSCCNKKTNNKKNVKAHHPGDDDKTEEEEEQTCREGSVDSISEWILKVKKR